MTNTLDDFAYTRATIAAYQKGISMSTPLVLTRTVGVFARPTVRTIAVAALLFSALTFLVDLLAVGPNEINVSHVILPAVGAGLASLRFRWAPALAALVGALMLVEAYLFVGRELTEPASATSFALAAIFIATSAIAFVAGVGATVQGYRRSFSHPLVDPPAPGWVYPALLAFSTLIVGGILTTAIQPRGNSGVTPEALATLPEFAAKDFQFQQPMLKARVGETVALRLENADTASHYLDIDELNVHVLMPPGKSSLALFTPTEPGTYLFYCQPHADKAASTGMVGTLVVEP